MKEKEIEKMACEYARKKLVYSHKLNAIMDVGVPDRVFITPYNYAFYVEFKQKGKQLQSHQKVYIDDMRSRGFDVLVLDDYETFKKCLDMRLKAPNNDYQYVKKNIDNYYDKKNGIEDEYQEYLDEMGDYNYECYCDEKTQEKILTIDIDYTDKHVSIPYIIEKDDTNNECALYIERHTNLRYTNAIEILKTESDNNTIVSLFLRHDNIDDRFIIEFSRALTANTTLTTLVLTDNNIGDEGAKELAKVLSVHKSLEKIHLESNNIGDEGAIALANALKVNTNIQEIYLDDNRISSCGTKMIREILKDIKAIKATKAISIYTVYKRSFNEGSQFVIYKEIDC